MSYEKVNKAFPRNHVPQTNFHWSPSSFSVQTKKQPVPTLEEHSRRYESTKSDRVENNNVLNSLQAKFGDSLQQNISQGSSQQIQSKELLQLKTIGHQEKLIEKNKKPNELNEQEASNIGREALAKIGYEEIIKKATEVGFLKKKEANQQFDNIQREPSSTEGRIFRQVAEAATTFGQVFSRFAVTAGVTSQLDSPVPGPADFAALGILAFGLGYATGEAINVALEEKPVVYMAAPGNQADTGIMGEAGELIRVGDAKDICDALAKLMAAAKRAGDKAKMQRIKKTQKAKDCRHSRHS